MGKLTGHMVPPDAVLIEKTHEGVKYSFAIPVPDFSKMTEEQKAAIRLRLEEEINRKNLAEIALLEQQRAPYSIGVKPRSVDDLVIDQVRRKGELVEAVMYPQGRPGVPKVKLPVRDFRIGGQLALTVAEATRLRVQQARQPWRSGT